MSKVRVCAIQFATVTSVEENLQTCLRMIDRAALTGPELIVLPEFCNHLSWYSDQQHAYDVAVDRQGPFLSAIAERAVRHDCFISINVSLRRDPGDIDAITVTSCLYSPTGECILEADKQTLMGHENRFFRTATTATPVVDTAIGKLGMFPCRDGVTCETPRSLALRGAELFIDSLNSFALDEASLHVPARAYENRVFLVAANKIGPLIPEDLLAAVSADIAIPEKYLYGAGESQIVDPTGKVLARAPRGEEAVIVAEVDLSESANKLRPDGTDRFKVRCPELYADIVSEPSGEYCVGGAASVPVACYAPEHIDTNANTNADTNADTKNKDIDNIQFQVAEFIVGKPPASLVVLPELCGVGPISAGTLADAAQASADFVAVLVRACAATPELRIATSIVEQEGQDFYHTAVLLGADGIELAQRQLHRTQRHGGISLGQALIIHTLPWGKVALLTGDDPNHPEIVRVAALRGVHALIAPIAVQEECEVSLGLRSRAAENRINVVACSAPTPFGQGVIAALEEEFTLMTPWEHREFDGNINLPLQTLQRGQATYGNIVPIAATNKVMSENTDLLRQRPWRLANELVSSVSA